MKDGGSNLARRCKELVRSSCCCGGSVVMLARSATVMFRGLLLWRMEACSSMV